MDQEVSFTAQIKDEITSLVDLSNNKKKSLLAAFIRSSGFIKFKDGKDYLILKTENAKVAKFIYSIIKEYYNNISVTFSYRKSMKFYKATEYLINILDGMDIILSDLNFDIFDSKIPLSLTNKDEKIKGYLMGLFLSCGSCNSPYTSNYHFEYYINDESFAKAVLKMTLKIKDVIFNFKMITRKNKYVLYLKKSDQIAEILAYLDANNCCLKFEDVRVDRDFNNVNNRLINCDTYNYKKSVDKAKSQIEAINKLDKYLGINNIANEKVKLLCKLRLKEPEASYNDLAEMMSKELEKKVSKSNINHLFIKINEMVEEYGKDR